MYPVSTAFKEAVRRSHLSIVKAEVWRGDTKILTLEPIGGQVEVDARRGVRRTCQVSVVAPDPTLVLDRQAATYANLANEYATYAVLAASVTAYANLELTDASVTTEVDAGIVPDSALSALAPFGNELRLWRGIRVEREVGDNYADLSSEYDDYADLDASYATYGELQQGITTETVDELVPLGVFVITKVDVATAGDGTTVVVTGSDRSLRISRARWTEPYQVSGNTASAVQDVLEDRWDDVQVDFTATDKSVNKARFGLETDNDPWKDATKLATAAGMELFFDGDGIARMIPVRDYETATPDAIYQENEEAMILTLSRSLTNETTYNGVIAAGESSEASVTYRGEAWDEDIDSPTYRYGPFGEVPLFYASPLLTSDDMARQAAESILAKKKGTTEAVEWSQIVDPSLDVGDVVAVTNARSKVDRLMVLDRLIIPLAPAAAMTAVARTIRSLGGTGFEEAESAA
jgi:hypothetical protein